MSTRPFVKSGRERKLKPETLLRVNWETRKIYNIFSSKEKNIQIYFFVANSLMIPWEEPATRTCIAVLSAKARLRLRFRITHPVLWFTLRLFYSKSPINLQGRYESILFFYNVHTDRMPLVFLRFVINPHLCNDGAHFEFTNQYERLTFPFIIMVRVRVRVVTTL